MKVRLVFFGVLSVLCLITGSLADSSDVWNVKINGPDGNITIGQDELKTIVDKDGVPIQIDGQDYVGASLWQILALVDSQKSLGPGDIIMVSGETTLEVPYQVINKNDGYLFLDMVTGPYLYVSPDVTGAPVNAVTSLDVSSTDDWSLLIKSDGGEIEVPKENWKELFEKHPHEKVTDFGKFIGITINDLLVSQDISPRMGSMIKITGQDGYAVEIPWDLIIDSPDYLLADQVDNEELPKYLNGLYGPDVRTPAWPLIQVDSEFPGENSVGNIVALEILD